MKILFLIFITLFCKENSKKAFKPIEENKSIGSYFFNYGEKIEITEPEKEISWGVQLRSENKTLCILSNSEFFLNREYGPKFGICFDETENNKNLFQSIQNETDLKNKRPRGELDLGDLRIPISVSTLTELIHEFKDLNEKRFLFGDSKLESEVEKKISGNYSKSISLKSNDKIKIESNFDLDYLSILFSNKQIFIVFPYLNNQYISIEISKLSSLKEEIINYFNDIESIQRNLKEKCISKSLKITEVNLSNRKKFRRYIEWQNESDDIICIHNLNINNTISIPTQSSFYFPRQVRLIFEEPEFRAFWRELKIGNSLFISNTGLTNETKMERDKSLLSSFKIKEFNCSWSNIFQEENFCGDPGLELEYPQSKGIKECNISNFSLTEINPFGVEENFIQNRNAKFIELFYNGNESCKFNENYLKIGNRILPLELDKLIKKNSYLLLTNTDIYTNQTYLIPIDLSFLNLRERISLLTENDEKELFKGIDSNDEYLLKSKKGNIYSLVYSNNHLDFHSDTESKKTLPVLSKKHFFSPGENNILKENLAQGLLSEIHWAGSYNGMNSITDEDFVEIVSNQSGSLHLKIESNEYIRNYFFPVEENDSYISLINKTLSCFPKIESILAEEIKLQEEKTKISLFRNGMELDKIEYNPAFQQGLNLTQKRQRFSYINTFKNNIWTNSSEEINEDLLSECRQRTFASPSKANYFPSFLIQNTIISSIYNRHLTHSIRFYTNSGWEENRSISNLNSIINPPVDKNALYYSEILPGRALNLYINNGLVIKAVHPSPNPNQKEWVLLCNESNEIKNITEYELEDETSSDNLVSFFSRTKRSLPSNLNSQIFNGNENNIKPKQCIYILDPDTSEINLKPFGEESPTLIGSIQSTSTIGNGISSGEYLDLYLKKEARIHVHSFGNRFSHSPFRIPARVNETIFLKNEKKGESVSDYEVLIW